MKPLLFVYGGIMARRNWSKCKCGVKLNIKKGHKICYVCERKQRKQ